MRFALPCTAWFRHLYDLNHITIFRVDVSFNTTASLKTGITVCTEQNTKSGDFPIIIQNKKGGGGCYGFEKGRGTG
ncbi:MAG: hypothetical protein V3R54_03660 [Thermodesulfovibrionia bacterium]